MESRISIRAEYQEEEEEEDEEMTLFKRPRVASYQRSVLTVGRMTGVLSPEDRCSVGDNENDIRFTLKLGEAPAAAITLQLSGAVAEGHNGKTGRRRRGQPTPPSKRCFVACQVSAVKRPAISRDDGGRAGD